MKFTVHGRRRILERKISEDLIAETVANPSQSFYDFSSSANVVFNKLNGKHLMVVYVHESNEIRVITTFITSAAEEIIRSKLSNHTWVKTK